MSKETIVCSLNFAQEYSANDIISLCTLPADARVLSVELVSNAYTASAADFIIGHGASASYSADPDAFSMNIFGVAGPDIMQRIDGRGQKKDEALPVILTFNSATTDITGSVLHVVIDYVQE